MVRGIFATYTPPNKPEKERTVEKLKHAKHSILICQMIAIHP
jgi:hypothetical protein